MIRPLVGVIALTVFIACWRKFGFKLAVMWASVLILAVPAFTMTALLIPATWREVGIPVPSLVERSIAGLVFVIAAIQTAKHIGWGKVLLGIFHAAVVVSYFALMGLIIVGALSLARGH